MKKLKMADAKPSVPPDMLRIRDSYIYTAGIVSGKSEIQEISD